MLHPRYWIAYLEALVIVIIENLRDDVREGVRGEMMRRGSHPHLKRNY
jgi:hypothetical protein